MDKAFTDAEARVEHRRITDRAYALLAQKNKTREEIAEVNRLFDEAAELYAKIARGGFIDDDMKSTRERSQI
jgi:uncharacterized sporulation protein YeaH/YhbH (DUF444 family)